MEGKILQCVEPAALAVTARVAAVIALYKGLIEPLNDLSLEECSYTFNTYNV